MHLSSSFTISSGLSTQETESAKKWLCDAFEGYDHHDTELAFKVFKQDGELHFPGLGVIKGSKDISEWFSYLYRGAKSETVINSAHFTNTQAIAIVEEMYTFGKEESLTFAWIIMFDKDPGDVQVTKLQLFGEVSQFLKKLLESGGELPIHIFNAPTSVN
ncbi:hypothetical protein BKA70DRAFT_1565809 [Coprinopsis sp. MPI-PUGE-AT-0042]|nr:hypothetical protein BKA70DRAFT_1565809 [Coprinopsis sp. MPI-PUGE-AT-0042]